MTGADDEVFGLSTSGGESIARSVLHWRPSGALTIDAGGEFAFNWLTTRTAFADNGVAIAVPAANVHVVEERGEAFALATWRPNAALAVEAGVRVEDSTIASSGDVVLTKTLVYPKPRVVLTWSPDADDQLRVRVEREVGQLRLHQLRRRRVLEHERRRGRQPEPPAAAGLGVRGGVRPAFLEGRGGVPDRAPPDPDPTWSIASRFLGPSGFFDEPGNIGGGTEDDIVGSFSVPLDHFFIPGGVFRGLGTWRFSKVTDPTTGETRPISGEHPFDGELHFSQDLPRWRLNWGLDSTIGYVERFYRFDEIDTNRKGTWNSVFVVYKARPDLTFRFEVDNLTRRPYTLTRQVFGGPRDISPLDFIDVQERHWGFQSYFHVRKTFQ